MIIYDNIYNPFLPHTVKLAGQILVFPNCDLVCIHCPTNLSIGPLRRTGAAILLAMILVVYMHVEKLNRQAYRAL